MPSNFSMEVETKEFNKHIKDFMKKTNLSTETVLKKFAFDLLARIIRKTPVDTGRARGGWFVAMEALGAQSSRSIEFNISRKAKGGKSKAVTRDAFEEGKAQGQFIDHTKGHLNKWIEIINGVEYIIFLEYGGKTGSAQAPFGMVRVSMREIRKGELPKNMTKEMQKDWNKFY